MADYCYIYANNKRNSRATKRKYCRLARLIDEYEKDRHIEMNNKTINETIMDDFIYFIKCRKPLKKNHDAYRLSTIERFYSSLVSIIHLMKKSGINISQDFTVKIKKEDCETVSLSNEEIMRLNELKLKKESAQVRDIFLVGCCTALRYSDYTRLREDNFKNDRITILTSKTDTRVVIPIHHIIRDIIERNKGYDFLNYKNSMQNFNMIIKRVCRRAGIDDKITIERTEGFKKVRRTYKKYELVSSHTARRSGATNMYLAGIPPFRIMLITGHKTESAFYRYIRIQKEENAKELAENKFFSGK